MTKQAPLPPWTSFLTAHWTRTPPTKPGHYFVADRDGVVRGLVRYRQDARGRVVAEHLGPNVTWLGWFWSEPVPDAPARPVPEWEDE